MWALSGTQAATVTENRSGKAAGDGEMRANATPRYTATRGRRVLARGHGVGGAWARARFRAPRARGAARRRPLAAPENATATAPVHPPRE